MRNVLIGWLLLVAAITALAVANEVDASPEYEAYVMGVKDTLAHLYRLCMDEQAFVMVGEDGTEVTFMCIEKRGQYL